MAGMMIRCRSLQFLKNSCKINNRYIASDAYYVLLPEIPPDTPADNAIMRTDGLPEFSCIDAGSSITGCAKLAIEYEVKLSQHIDRLKDGATEKTFESVFDPIEEIGVPLNTSWKTLKNLNYVIGDQGYREAFQRVHPQVERVKNERWVNDNLYNAVQEVNKDVNLTDLQANLVKTYMSEFKMNGIELDARMRKQFVEILGKVVEQKRHFRNRVMLSHNLYELYFDNLQDFPDMPSHIADQLAVNSSNPKKGPWRVTLNANHCEPYLAYCSNRTKRYELWNALNNRSSIKHDEKNLSNHIIIKEIRNFRSDISEMLGFENYAEMTLSTKMAGNVENVVSMIDRMRTHFYPLAEEEIKSLQEFANQQDGFTHQLEMWDLPYYRRKQKEYLFRLNDSDIKEYFPLPAVIENMFSIIGGLFGLRFELCSSSSSGGGSTGPDDLVQTWHSDVSFYRVYDADDSSSGEKCREIAAFYMDPYARHGQKATGAWMETGRDRSSVCKTKPYSYMNLNLTPPTMYGDVRPSLLTLNDLSVLCYEFGHGLQQWLATDVLYSENSGQRSIAWDALQVPAQLMTMLMLTPESLHNLSCHVDSGQQIPLAVAEKALAMRNHMKSFDLMKQLYYSAYDMEMYISTGHWYTTMEKLWTDFIPLPLNEDDNHPCSFTAIFSDQYAATYYSVKWAEMLAADIFQSFKDQDLNNPEKQAIVGRQFRDNYLRYGGGLDANEVFQRFKGRSPDQQAFIDYHSSQ